MRQHPFIKNSKKLSLPKRVYFSLKKERGCNEGKRVKVTSDVDIFLHKYQDTNQ